MWSFSDYFTQATLSAFLAGVLFGVGGYWFLVGHDETLSQAPTEENTSIIDTKSFLEGGVAQTDSIILITEGKNSFVVADQPSGDVVIVSMISLETSGWVAVHEEIKTNIDGESKIVLGNILGASRFNAGQYFGEKIGLLRGTIEGQTYVVVLHADNGDSYFDYTKELPMKNLSGDLFTTEFLTTANAGIEFPVSGIEN